MATDLDQYDDWRGILDPALVGATKSWHAYTYDQVPGGNGNPGVYPGIYVAITISRRYGNDLRLSGGRRLVGYRLTTLAVGRTVREAQWARDRVSAAIADQRLPIAGETTTFVRMEAENPIEPDDGRYSGDTRWTYAV